jgi:hypothetical protein
MKTKTLMNGSLLTASIIAVVICVGMVTGFSVVKPFISVDPVSDKNVGNQFTINGKTSLPAGTEIIAEVYPAVYEDQTGTGSGEFTGATATVTIVKGTDGANTWSWPLDTATFKPMEYLVSVSSVKGDLSKGEYTKGDISGSTKFTLHQGSATADERQYIIVDPVADKTTGDLLIVTGSTNLPAGTILMIQTGSYGVGFGSDTMVREGTGGINRYSMPVDTSLLKPGTQTITVNNMLGDLAKGDYRSGTVKGAANFTLKGTYLGADTPVQVTVTKDDYIRLNAIGNRSVGDQFLITGTTSLPAGTTLIWDVMPDTGTPPTDLDLNATGIMANNAVTKGDGTSNRVSLAVDMSGYAPGKWVALVGKMKSDPTKRDIKMGDPVGSALFNLK